MTADQSDNRTAQDARTTVPSVLVVTGLSGAGRTTAISALEDLGFEGLNNFPLVLVERLFDAGDGGAGPIAIGVETRTRGFSARALMETVDRLRARHSPGAALIFLDCSDEVLLARFNQTRRRHPLAPAEDAATGVQRERDILQQVRDRADLVIDTSAMSPHDLKTVLEARFAPEQGPGLSVTVKSFSYKRGIPHGADMVLDCRFLMNPYWEESLRALDGRDKRIQDFVRDDPRYPKFFGKLCDMLEMLLPAYRTEGKAHFTLALGCSGGRHRSVTVAEAVMAHLNGQGWAVSLRHQELDRQAGGGAA